MMRNVLLKGGCFVFLMALGLTVVKASTKEEALSVVKESVMIMLDDLAQNEAIYRDDPSRLNDIVDQKMLPFFDVDAMARFVLGQNWLEATSQQQQDFINEFKQLVMRTYSSSMLDYVGAAVDYGDPSEVRRNRTKIPVTVTNKVGERYALELSLRYKDGAWKLYDVALDGLSVITSYRSSLGQEVAQKGLQQVIDEIKSLNERGAIE